MCCQSAYQGGTFAGVFVSGSSLDLANGTLQDSLHVYMLQRNCKKNFPLRGLAFAVLVK